jgi:hypothetical protein
MYLTLVPEIETGDTRVPRKSKQNCKLVMSFELSCFLNNFFPQFSRFLYLIWLLGDHNQCFSAKAIHVSFLGNR